jgi:hypothetical protein
MVSDIVLLKELPEYIKGSVAAYIGCLSGAIDKDEYLTAIRTAGFSNVKVIEKNSFPLDCAINDPTVQAVIGELKITPKQVEEISTSISSIKVSALKNALA